MDELLTHVDYLVCLGINQSVELLQNFCSFEISLGPKSHIRFLTDFHPLQLGRRFPEPVLLHSTCLKAENSDSHLWFIRENPLQGSQVLGSSSEDPCFPGEDPCFPSGKHSGRVNRILKKKNKKKNKTKNKKKTIKISVLATPSMGEKSKQLRKPPATCYHGSR